MALVPRVGPDEVGATLMLELRAEERERELWGREDGVEVSFGFEVWSVVVVVVLQLLLLLRRVLMAL